MLTSKGSFIVGLGMMGIGAGIGALGYFLMKRKLEAEFEARLQVEIKETKAYYSRLSKKPPFSDPTRLVEEYIPTESEEEDLILIENARNKREKKPYLISQDAFAHGYDAPEYDQITLTYYEEDDVLADEKDEVQDDSDSTVGNANLLHWGWGSNDNELIYVRNDILATDFEIVRNKGSYAKIVLGFIEHSEPRGRPRKFRRDYE